MILVRPQTAGGGVGNLSGSKFGVDSQAPNACCQLCRSSSLLRADRESW